MRCNHKLWERQSAATDNCPICTRYVLSVMTLENARLREIESELRTALAAAYAEMRSDGVAQNISSATFDMIHKALGRVQS